MKAVIYKLGLVAALVLSAGMRDAGPAERTEFNAVDGIDGGLTIAVGDRGTIVHFSQGMAKSMPSHTHKDLLSVHVGSGDFALAAGRGVVLQWDGLTWLPLPAEPDAEYSGVWATENRGLILLTTVESNGHRLCPRSPRATQQPFCRRFELPVRGVCGDEHDVYLVLSNGQLHHVNNALIGEDGSFGPAFNPARPLNLRSAWVPGGRCGSGHSLPEVFAIDEGDVLVHFNGRNWQPASSALR